MRMIAPGFTRRENSAVYVRGQRHALAGRPVGDARARKGVRQVADMVGSTASGLVPKGRRLLTTHQLFDVYCRTPDIRAPMDSIARRVSGQDWLIEPANVPEDRPILLDRVQAECERLTTFFRHPDRMQSWAEWCFQIVLDGLIYGAGAAELATGERTRRVRELALIRGDDIDPVWDDHGRLVKYEQWTSGHVSATFEPGELIYLNLFPSTYQPRPVPIIESVINEVVTLLCSSERAMLALDADEIPPGLLVLANVVGDALTMFQADMQSFRGRDNRLRVVGASEADAKWIRFDRDFKDVEFLDVVKEIRDRVWRLLGVTKADMGDVADANRANMETQIEVGDAHLIRPVLVLLKEKLETQAFPKLVRDPDLLPYLAWAWDFDDSLTPEGEKDLASALDTHVAAGIMSRDEARFRLGLRARGGDAGRLMVATNAGPVPLQTDDDEPDTGEGVAAPEGGDEPDIKSRQPQTRATDFPNQGDDEAVRLENSEYPQFDYGFMADLKQDHPDVWDLGGNDSPEKEWSGDRAFRMWSKARDGDYTDTVEEWVKTRESWAARHYGNKRIAGVVAQGKWGVIGTLGEGGMKDLIREEIEKRESRAAWLPGLMARPANFDRHYWADCVRVDDLRATGLETEDLPSEWQAASRFTGKRTINLPDLGRAVVAYHRDVLPLYRECRNAVETAIRAAYDGDTLPQSAVGRVVRRIDDALDRMLLQWSLATEERYRQAVQVADDAAERWLMVQPEAAREYASAYQRRAMAYLTEEPGLVWTLRDKLYAFVSGVARGLPLPDMAATHPAGCGCAEHRTAIENPLSVESLEDALAAVGALFAAQEHRIDNWSGKLVEECFGRLNGHAQGSGTEWYAEWVAVGDAMTCPDCVELASAGFQPLGAIRTVPGGDTQCGARCRCVLVYWTRSEVESGEAESLTMYDA